MPGKDVKMTMAYTHALNHGGLAGKALSVESRGLRLTERPTPGLRKELVEWSGSR